MVPDKKEINIKIKKIEDDLEGDIQVIIQRSVQILGMAAISGTAFWLVYRLFSKKKPNGEKEVKEEREPGVASQLLKFMGEKAILMLLGIIKQELVRYLDKNHAHTSDNTSEDS